jgi:zinc/manganese transport system permease protein
MVNAFRAGTAVAITAGLLGWFMVLRRQSFAGHTLALIGFPGAAGAVYLGASAAWGYFAFCAVGAAAIGALPRGGASGYAEESPVIGTIQALALASGFLFVSLYHGFLSGINGLLFGTFLGITDEQVAALALVAVVVVAGLAWFGRPLLFASIDPDVAAARKLPVRLLGLLFLLFLGLATAEASQITGSLLVFALLVMPAAAAQALTARPVVGLGLSVAIALAVTWGGLTAAYYSPYPIGFFITTFAFAVYLVARVVGAVRTAGAVGARR